MRAVDGVDLDVAEGEVVGFLGPNGAGQDHHAADADHAAPAHRRHRHGRRVRRRQAVRGGPPPHRLRLADRRRLQRRPGRRRGRRPRDALRDEGGRGDRDGARSCSSQLDLDGLWARHAQEHVRWPAPPPRHRHGADPRADAGLPRRADHRPGPAGPSQPVGAHRRPAPPPRAPRCSSRRTTSTRPTPSATGSSIIDHGRIVAADTSDNLKAQVAGDLVDLELDRPRARWPTRPAA